MSRALERVRMLQQLRAAAQQHAASRASAGAPTPVRTSAPGEARTDGVAAAGSHAITAGTGAAGTEGRSTAGVVRHHVCTARCTAAHAGDERASSSGARELYGDGAVASAVRAAAPPGQLGAVELGHAVLRLRAQGATRGAGRPVALDLETTGLGGAATIPFLTALAWVCDHGPDGPHIHVEQLLLQRPGAEPELLRQLFARVAAVAGEGGELLTYNGASFDLPLLRTRAARHGVDAGALRRPHVDLLPAVRRLWRAELGSARLARVEAARLGVVRLDDLPGHELPAVWAELLHAPDSPATAARVLQARRHSAVDVAVLPALAVALATELRAPRDRPTAVRAARFDEALGRRAAAIATLERVVAGPGGGSDWREAALTLAQLWRRAGEHERAARLWEAITARCPGDEAAHEQLASHLEHRGRDPAAALAVAAASHRPCAHRVARLQHKVARAASSVRVGAAARGAGSG